MGQVLSHKLIMVLCTPNYWLVFAMEVILLPREWQGTQEILNMNSEAAQWSIRDLQGCTKPPLDSTRCTSHWTPANREIPGQETVTHTHCSNSCLPTLSVFFSPQLSFKIPTRGTQLCPNSLVSGLYSVLITEWDQLGILGWAPLPELQSVG
jgi:hypothetical protein